ARSSMIPATAMPAVGARMVAPSFQVCDVSFSTVWAPSPTRIGLAGEADCNASRAEPRDSSARRGGSRRKDEADREVGAYRRNMQQIGTWRPGRLRDHGPVQVDPGLA